jgi:hypothetical protein
MKAIAYFYDKYGIQGTSVAGFIWPLSFILFYFMFQKRIIPSLIASFTLASFMALFYFNDYLSCLIFFCGLGLLLFGTCAMYAPSKHSVYFLLIGIISCGLLGMLARYLYIIFYPEIPEKNYQGNSEFIYSSISSYLFTIPFIIIYIIFFYFMFKNNN